MVTSLFSVSFFLYLDCSSYTGSNVVTEVSEKQTA